MTRAKLGFRRSIRLKRLQLGIRWNRLRKGLWRERCEACGKRMPLDGTGVQETVGLLHFAYHTHCHVIAAQRMALNDRSELTR